MRRMSVSTTASRISNRARGRSAHRKSAEVLMGADVRRDKEGDVLVVQTVSRLVLLALGGCDCG